MIFSDETSADLVIRVFLVDLIVEVVGFWVPSLERTDSFVCLRDGGAAFFMLLSDLRVAPPPNDFVGARIGRGMLVVTKDRS